MYDIVRHKKMLKFTFNALIQQQYLLWLRPLHTAEKHCPTTMFHTATVRPKRSGPSILYNTPLSLSNARLHIRLLRLLGFTINNHFVLSITTDQPKCFINLFLSAGFALHRQAAAYHRPISHELMAKL